MNNVSIVGRLSADPELKTTTAGVSVTNYTLAVDRPHVKNMTDWISCVSWRQQAEYLCRYARKGNLVAVDGVLTSRSYEDKNGNKRTVYEVVTTAVQILSYNQHREEKIEDILDDEDCPVSEITPAVEERNGNTSVSADDLPDGTVQIEISDADEADMYPF